MDQTQSSRGKKRSATVAADDPAIPDKLYFRIGEAARLLSIAPYVLRFWESEFPQLRPNKGGTGQRLYRKRDVETALRIKRLLYQEGYTIPGARQLLKAEQRDRGTREDPEGAAEAEGGSGTATAQPEPAQVRLQRVRAGLKEIASMLDQPAPARVAVTAPRAKAARTGLHLASRRDLSPKVLPALLFPEK